MPRKTRRDLYEEFKSEYVKPKQPLFVVVGPAKYLSISGQGAPGGEQFRSHIAALYSVAFTVKMAEKLVGQDYNVCHLEGQWWADDGSDFRRQRPNQWRWQARGQSEDLLHHLRSDCSVISHSAPAPA